MKVFLIAAVTADGYIGRDEKHTADWTSPEDKKLFVRLTKEAGVMVMGSRTFATIGRALPGRRTIVYTTHPENITQDGVEATTETPNDLVSRLASQGTNGVAVCGGASIYTLFMQAGVVDELYLTVEPKLFGAGVGLFSGKIEYDLTLLSADKLNEHAVLFHYAVNKTTS